MYVVKPWPVELAESLQSVEDMVAAGLLSSEEAHALNGVQHAYHTRIPRYYVGLMDLSPQGRNACPIRLQAVPCVGEEEPSLPLWLQEWSMQVYGRASMWTTDPTGDLEKWVAPRLTHRYANRVLLHTSSVCSMYCRYCFRKNHLQSQERALYGGAFDPALAYIQQHPSVTEVVLTGGDPLSLPDKTLARLLDALDAVEHVRHIRIHTRMPVTLPSRITQECVAALSGRRCVVSVVSHFNHVKECTPMAMEAMSALRRASVVLYNQSVLLKDVNNSADTLAQLFQRLYEEGVRPFYLHHTDWTKGTLHFRTTIREGREWMRALQGRISGPAMPSYVLDVPGGYGKVPLMASGVVCEEECNKDGWYAARYTIDLPSTLDSNVKKVSYIDAVCVR